jgi:glycosyltransferase involved in cell wall biosynthesis
LFKLSNLSYVDADFSNIDKKQGYLKLIYLSRVSPVKNLDFAIQTLSKVDSSKNFLIEYDIYGNNEDKEYFKYCKELMKQLPSNIKVTYKGTLSFDEIPKVISLYHFLFLPTKNENFGHAIVETLSCGRPVLISNCTPWNEVNEYQCGYALPLDENIFAEKLYEILNMDNDTFQKMCVNAHSFINKKMDIEKIKTEYLNLFEYAAQFKNN